MNFAPNQIVYGHFQKKKSLISEYKIFKNQPNFLIYFSDKKHGMSVDDLELRTLLQEDPFPDSEVPR